MVLLPPDGSFTRVRSSRSRRVGFTDKLKVKVTLEQVTEVQMGGGGIVILRRWMVVGGQSHVPAALPLGKTRYLNILEIKPCVLQLPVLDFDNINP
jgi:hypothetical protein